MRDAEFTVPQKPPSLGESAPIPVTAQPMTATDATQKNALVPVTPQQLGHARKRAFLYGAGATVGLASIAGLVGLLWTRWRA